MSLAVCLPGKLTTGLTWAAILDVVYVPKATLCGGGLIPSIVNSFIHSDCRRSGKLFYNFAKAKSDKKRKKYIRIQSEAIEKIWKRLPLKIRWGMAADWHLAAVQVDHKIDLAQHLHRSTLEWAPVHFARPVLALDSTILINWIKISDISLWYYVNWPKMNETVQKTQEQINFFLVWRKRSYTVNDNYRLRTKKNYMRRSCTRCDIYTSRHCTWHVHLLRLNMRLRL